MAHYAEIDENSIVKQVIVVNNDILLDENGIEQEQKGVDFCTELFGGTWIRTSIHTDSNEHLLGKEPVRGNAASIGMVYDPVRDVFYLPQPFPSWTLNENTYTWEPPVPYPQVEQNPYTPEQLEYWTFKTDAYIWNESNKNWDLIPNQE